MSIAVNINIADMAIRAANAKSMISLQQPQGL